MIGWAMFGLGASCLTVATLYGILKIMEIYKLLIWLIITIVGTVAIPFGVWLIWGYELCVWSIMVIFTIELLIYLVFRMFC